MREKHNHVDDITLQAFSMSVVSSFAQPPGKLFQLSSQILTALASLFQSKLMISLFFKYRKIEVNRIELPDCLLTKSACL